MMVRNEQRREYVENRIRTDICVCCVRFCGKYFTVLYGSILVKAQLTFYRWDQDSEIIK